MTPRGAWCAPSPSAHVYTYARAPSERAVDRRLSTPQRLPTPCEVVRVPLSSLNAALHTGMPMRTVVSRENNVGRAEPQFLRVTRAKLSRESAGSGELRWPLCLIFRHPWPCFRQGGLERGCPRPTVVSIIYYCDRQMDFEEEPSVRSVGVAADPAVRGTRPSYAVKPDGARVP